MMRWAIEIQKTDLSRRNLADLLHGLGFILIDDVDFLAFTSPIIDACNSSAEAFDQAKKLRAAFTGPAKIDSAFELGAVIDFSSDPPKRHHCLEAKPIVKRFFIGAPTLSVSPPQGLSDDEFVSWQKEQAEREYQSELEQQRVRLEPAYLNPRAEKVLDLLSKEHPSGETIYKIYELMEGHPKNRKAFHEQFSVTDDKFMRFKDAVHNVTVSGDWARHAYEENPKTSNPMTKSEAILFVRQIAIKWLEYI